VNNRSSQMIQTVLRVILSGGLLTAILMTINIDEAILLIGKSNFLFLAAAALVFLTIRIVTALRWFVMLCAYGVKIPYSVVLRITFISTAVGQFIPGGAAAASIYQVFKESGKLAEISVAVLLDRLFGIAAMLIIATGGVLVAVEEAWMRNLVLTMAVLLVIMLLLSTRLVGSIFLRKFLSGRLESRFHRVARGALRLIELVSDRPTFKKAAGPIILASIAVQILRILAFSAIYASLGADIPIVYFVAFVPLLYLVLSFPISIAGLGVRESVLVILFGTLGVAAEVSVAAGLLMPLLLLVGVLPGLILLSIGSSTSQRDRITLASTDNHK
jgi:uncharacterized protein (TIRG00374 family)